jgi:predicted MFS family arabinose efflux permease
MPLHSTLRFIIVLLVLAHLSFIGTRVAISLFAIQLKASTLTVGMLMSLLSLIPMFLAIHVGRWTDRVGVRRPCVIALVAMVLGALVPWAWPSIGSLYATSVLLGTGFMLVHVAINNAVGHASTPENRTHSFTMLALGFSTSSVLGPVVAGFSIDLVGHARTFLLLAAFPLAALGLLWAIWQRTPRPPRAAHPAEDIHVLDLLRNKPLRAVFIASGLLSMGWDLFTFMVPVQGVRIGLSASTIGVIMGTFGAATFVVRLAMPWISRRLNEWQTITAALSITAFVYYLFPLFTAVPVLLALAFLLGLGLGSAQPMVMSLLHRVSPVGRTGEAVGVRTTLINASHTTLPLLFGGLGSALGTAPAFWALALILSAGGVFAGRHRGAA